MATAKPSPAETQARLDALDKEAADLDRSLSGWTYVLPSYLYGNMTKTENQLLRPPKSQKPATPDGRNH